MATGEPGGLLRIGMPLASVEYDGVPVGAGPPLSPGGALTTPAKAGSPLGRFLGASSSVADPKVGRNQGARYGERGPRNDAAVVQQAGYAEPGRNAAVLQRLQGQEDRCVPSRFGVTSLLDDGSVVS